MMEDFLYYLARFIFLVGSCAFVWMCWQSLRFVHHALIGHAVEALEWRINNLVAQNAREHENIEKGMRSINMRVTDLEHPPKKRRK